MVRFRSILAAVLAVILIVFVIGSYPAEAAKAKAPYTYTPEQLEQINRSTADLQELRDRLLELPPLIQQNDWVDVKNFIHGPLGELRAKMVRLSRNLAPDAQKAATKTAKDVFGHLIAIDEAANSLDSTKAFRNYNELLKDFDAFFQLIPA
ncbi:MAG: photosystem II protein PsbQ [Cyanobacteria bacterium CRU_2_1]|nr:photosystem II protein PsbQ [Cyanobacteria bacterium RU_5_0]NJR57680.1 photosystem II protein PsbQ [Cyanobacteria bacterium CRU_2_1]